MVGRTRKGPCLWVIEFVPKYVTQVLTVDHIIFAYLVWPMTAFFFNFERHKRVCSEVLLIVRIQNSKIQIQIYDMIIGVRWILRAYGCCSSKTSIQHTAATQSSTASLPEAITLRLGFYTNMVILVTNVWWFCGITGRWWCRVRRLRVRCSRVSSAWTHRD